MKFDSNVISRAKQMKLIMQFGVGVEGNSHVINQLSLDFFGVSYVHVDFYFGSYHEGIDIDAATKSGIRVARIPSSVTGNAASCAEMAIFLILGLLRKQVCFFLLLLYSLTANTFMINQFCMYNIEKLIFVKTSELVGNLATIDIFVIVQFHMISYFSNIYDQDQIHPSPQLHHLTSWGQA